MRAEQVLRVYAAPDGWWASLAQGGLMRYDAQEKSWRRAGAVTGAAAAAVAQPGRSSRPRSRSSQTGPHQLVQVVNDMAFSSNRWFAATEMGLLVSTDHGAIWTVDPIGPLTALPVRSVRVSSNGERVWVVSLRGMVFSIDGGKSWSWHDLPLNAGGAVTLDVDRADENTLISIAHNGLYISRNAGNFWEQAGAGLPSTPAQDFTISGNVFLASVRTGGLYVSSDSGRTWTRLAGTLADGFFPVVAAESHAGVIFAASATEGLYAVEWTPSVAAFPVDSPGPRN